MKLLDRLLHDYEGVRVFEDLEWSNCYSFYDCLIEIRCAGLWDEEI